MKLYIIFFFFFSLFWVLVITVFFLFHYSLFFPVALFIYFFANLFCVYDFALVNSLIVLCLLSSLIYVLVPAFLYLFIIFCSSLSVLPSTSSPICFMSLILLLLTLTIICVTSTSFYNLIPTIPTFFYLLSFSRFVCCSLDLSPRQSGLCLQFCFC